MTIYETGSTPGAAIVLALASTSSSHAQDIDLIGTWTGTTRAVVVGAGGHYDGNAEPSFASVELNLEWTRQDDGRLIGTLTSGGFAPTVGGPIAMGYVPAAYAAQGTSLELIVRSRRLAATVADMPFVPNRYYRKPKT